MGKLMYYQSLPLTLNILDFWFSPEIEPLWFAKDNNFDEDLQKRFGKLHQETVSKISHNGVESITSAEEALTDVIILDQLSRNMFRGTPQAFAYDGLALQIAKFAVQKEFDLSLPPKQRNFLYMPFMHSENLKDQEEGIRLFANIPDNNDTVGYAQHHRDIIARFGRFPHRNAILGRTSTTKEIAFLKEFSGY